MQSARKSRYADILESVGGEATATGDASTPASAGGANNLDFTPPPDESAEAEEVEPEARSAMEQLAKAVTSSTSDSDINTAVGESVKEPSEREVFYVRGLAEVAEKFTRAVTKFCNAYHNEEAQIENAKPTSKTLADMKECYQNFISLRRSSD